MPAQRLRSEITASRLLHQGSHRPISSFDRIAGWFTPNYHTAKVENRKCLRRTLPNPARRRFSLCQERGSLCLKNPIALGSASEGSVVMLQNHREPGWPKRGNLRDTRTVHYFVGTERPPIYVALGSVYVVAMLAAALYLLFIAE
jgi:hypothetical protein